MLNSISFINNSLIHIVFVAYIRKVIHLLLMSVMSDPYIHDTVPSKHKTFVQHLYNNGSPTSQQTQNICITFMQCWTNVEDVGPTLYKCYTNVLCLLGLYKCYTKVMYLTLIFDVNMMNVIIKVSGYAITLTVEYIPDNDIVYWVVYQADTCHIND